MPRNDQAVRLLVIRQKLEASRQGVTLEQLSELLAPGSTWHPRTRRRQWPASNSRGFDGNGSLASSPASRVVVRIPDERIREFLKLAGKTLEVDGRRFRIGVP
jgi:hypothetical protein